MKNKFIWLLPLCFLITSCASQSSFLTSSSSDFDSFYNNPRIVFKDLKATKNQKSSNYIAKKTRKPSKSSTTAAIRATNTIGSSLAINTPLMGVYSESVNDRFNGVTKPIPRQLVSGSSQPILLPPANQSVKNSNVASDSSKQTSNNQVTSQSSSNGQQSTQQFGQQTAQQGTTVIPLTFPVPPPKTMMQQFNMKVGDSSGKDNSYDNN
jgi:hypothetical protein